MKLLEWIDNRTGFATAVKDYLEEDIPGGARWRYVFGSAVLFAFILQAVTGVFLAFYYTPSLATAYESVRYIMEDLNGGKYIRGLHYWGASFMVVLVFVHMAQTFIWGAYRKPREAMWLVGSLLLLFVLGMAFTGYLLPWDNAAYWGTQVGTNIMGTVPFVGDFIMRFLRGGADLGPLTLTRFYSIHVFIIPGALILLILLHLILFRRNGVTTLASDLQKPTQPFWPNQFARDATFSLLLFIVISLLAVVSPAELGEKADPTDVSYLPRPAWYFLFLFELLKFFPGRWEILASVGIPLVAVIVLWSLPFVDRSTLRTLASRRGAIGFSGLVLLAWVGFTYAANLPAGPGVIAAGPVAVDEASAQRGMEMVSSRKVDCLECHTINGAGGSVGPDLSAFGKQNKSVAYLESYIADPAKHRNDIMPAYGGSLKPEETHDLAEYAASLGVVTLAPQVSSPISAASVHASAEFGRELIVDRKVACLRCHVINGQGKAGGIDLSNYGAKERPAQQVVEYLKNPGKFSHPVMPQFQKLPDVELESLAAYLVSLKTAPSKKPNPELGKELLMSKKIPCLSCHTISGNGGQIGGDLSGIGSEGHDRKFFEQYLRNPKAFGNSIMPPFASLPPDTLNAVIDYLMTLGR